jgi:hypothetical protein
VTKFSHLVTLVALIIGFGSIPADAADLSKAYAALQGRNYESAASLLAATVKAEPTNSTAHRYYAAALTGLQQPERALTELRAAQAIDGIQSCDGGIEFRARVLFTRICISRGEMDKARKSYQVLTAKQPTGKEAAELRALSQEISGTEPAQPTAALTKG